MGLSRLITPMVMRRKAMALTRQHELSARILERLTELVYHPGMSGNVDVHYQDREIRGAICCTPAEATLMYHAARLFKPRHALEIGSYIGWSSAHLANGLQRCELICVDPFMETDASAGVAESRAAMAHRRFLQNMERAGVSGRVRLVRDKSPDAIPALSEDRQWDFVFVDGWHLQGQPLRDVMGVLPFVASDAVLLLHDLWIPDVRDALLYLVTQGWAYKVLDTSNYLTVLWRGQPPGQLAEFLGIASSDEFVLPAALGRKFVFGLVDESIGVASSAFGGGAGV
jgi:predicted O-methyltransferase YrrM